MHVPPPSYSRTFALATSTKNPQDIRGHSSFSWQSVTCGLRISQFWAITHTASKAPLTSPVSVLFQQLSRPRCVDSRVDLVGTGLLPFTFPFYFNPSHAYHRLSRSEGFCLPTAATFSPARLPFSLFTGVSMCPLLLQDMRTLLKLTPLLVSTSILSSRRAV